MKQFVSVYRWPLFAVIIWASIAMFQFGTSYLSELVAKFRDIDWWVENTLSFVIFTIFVSWVITLTQRNREKITKEPYLNWQVQLRGLSIDQKAQDIYWADVQKNEVSRFEKWKFVKTAISSTIWTSTLNIEEAEKRWLFYGDRLIIVDFSKMTSDDADMSKLGPKLKKVV